MILSRERFRNYFYQCGSHIFSPILFKPFRGRAAILCYHRVVPIDIFNSITGPLKDLSVSDKYFDNQMNYLAATNSVISMDKLVDHLVSDSKEFKIAITFDDGYKDNLMYALPILEKYSLPATIYISTRFPEDDCFMWWYQLWSIINKKNEIFFNWRNNNYHFISNKFSDRVKSYHSLAIILNVENLEKQKLILRMLDSDNKTKDYSNLCLTWDEIIRLSQSKLITIGSHTHNHLNLASLNTDILFYEIAHSIKLLESRIQKNIKHISYPFGYGKYINEKVISEVRNYNNIDTAVTTLVKPIRTNDLFSLPRIHMKNYSSDILSLKLSGFDNLINFAR